MENVTYLVCIPKGALYYCANKIQNFLWNKYNLGPLLPELHLTIDAYYYEDAVGLESIKYSIGDILKDIESFEINSNGFSYMPEPYNCITVHIVKDQKLKSIYEYIHKSMQERGFKTREFTSEEIVFHISLAGIHGRKWSLAESKNAWRDIRNFQLQEPSLINEFQLWLPDQHQPEERLITSYKLR